MKDQRIERVLGVIRDAVDSLDPEIRTRLLAAIYIDSTAPMSDLDIQRGQEIWSTLNK